MVYEMAGPDAVERALLALEVGPQPAATDGRLTQTSKRVMSLRDAGLTNTGYGPTQPNKSLSI